MSRADINRAYEAWKKSEMECLEDAYSEPSKRSSGLGSGVSVFARRMMVVTCVSLVIIVRSFRQVLYISRMVSARLYGLQKIRFERCL